MEVEITNETAIRGSQWLQRITTTSFMLLWWSVSAFSDDFRPSQDVVSLKSLGRITCMPILRAHLRRKDCVRNSPWMLLLPLGPTPKTNAQLKMPCVRYVGRKVHPVWSLTEGNKPHKPLIPRVKDESRLQYNWRHCTWRDYLPGVQNYLIQLF